MEPLNISSFYGIFKDISLIVHSSIQLDEVFELVVWKVTEAFQAKGALLRVHNPKTDQFEVTAVYGMNEQYLSKGAVSTDKIVDGDIKNKKPVIIEDLWNEPRVEYPQWAWDEGVRMIVDTPLYLGDKLISILRLYFSEKRTFSDKELDFLVAIATQCACAINKIKLIENQQDQFEQLAIQTEKLSALGRMAAGIAHEINNPLAGILLYSTHMKKKLPRESPLLENLEVIINETTRCKSTIQELLDFSREREPIKSLRNINAVIKRALDILENEFYLKHITLNTSLSGDVPDIPLDANQVEQVLINLLLNSIQAISHKNGVIQVQSRISEDKTRLVVEIEDNGCGIASKNLDKIFDPFFTTKPNGSGLGMSVSYGIIQNHNGEIQVSSKEGKGTRFCCLFPIAPEEQTSDRGKTKGNGKP
ncbi:MAG: GAF domain-containing protein [Desulfohalobiaceae bacterium]|nr:GAF domain-containing protein [Desulfohalobiaceae bacterium]